MGSPQEPTNVIKLPTETEGNESLAELRTLANIVELFEMSEPPARRRMLEWLTSRYGASTVRR